MKMDSLLRTFKSYLNASSGKHACIKRILKTKQDYLQSFAASIIKEIVITRSSKWIILIVNNAEHCAIHCTDK